MRTHTHSQEKVWAPAPWTAASSQYQRARQAREGRWARSQRTESQQGRRRERPRESITNTGQEEGGEEGGTKKETDRTMGEGENLLEGRTERDMAAQSLWASNSCPAPTLDLRSAVEASPAPARRGDPLPRPLRPRPPAPPRSCSPGLSSQLREARPMPARPPCCGGIRPPLLAPGGRGVPGDLREGPRVFSWKGRG